MPASCIRENASHDIFLVCSLLLSGKSNSTTSLDLFFLLFRKRLFRKGGSLLGLFVNVNLVFVDKPVLLFLCLSTAQTYYHIIY